MRIIKPLIIRIVAISSKIKIILITLHLWYLYNYRIDKCRQPSNPGTIAKQYEMLYNEGVNNGILLLVFTLLYYRYLHNIISYIYDQQACVRRHVFRIITKSARNLTQLFSITLLNYFVPLQIRLHASSLVVSIAGYNYVLPQYIPGNR